MKYILYSIICLLLVGLLACDIIDSNYREQPRSIDPDGNKNIRKVLLEEFTGFKCGYCPPANKTANDLNNLYHGRFVVVTIHAGSLAMPDDVHTYDFQTNVGTEINDAFGIKSNPIGVVNRAPFNDALLIKQDKWEQAAKTFFEKEPQMLINIKSNYSKNVDSLISVKVDVSYLDKGSANQRLSVFVIEDSIVQYQKWYNHTPNDNYDYVHHHVLRASMNGTWGDLLGTVAKGGKVEKSYNMLIPKDSEGKFLWKPEKIKIVAFVHNLEANTYEVLQAEEKDLMQEP